MIERRAEELLARSDELAKHEDYQAAVSLLENADPEVASLHSVKQGLERHRVQREARERSERERRERLAATLAKAGKAHSSGDLERAR